MNKVLLLLASAGSLLFSGLSHAGSADDGFGHCADWLSRPATSPPPGVSANEFADGRELCDLYVDNLRNLLQADYGVDASRMDAAEVIQRADAARAGSDREQELFRTCPGKLGMDPEELAKPSWEGDGWSEADLATLRAEQATCRALAAKTRASLQKDYGVKTAGISDVDVFARHDEERARRDEQRARAAEYQDRENQRAAAATEARIRSTAADAEKNQRAMLQSMGVDPDTVGAGDETTDDDNALDDEAPDPLELQVYQQMVDGGVAPECRGRKDQALIDCVDRALGE